MHRPVIFLTASAVIGWLCADGIVLRAADPSVRNQEFDPALQHELDRRAQMLKRFLDEDDRRARIAIAERVRGVERQLLKKPFPREIIDLLTNEHHGLLVWLEEQYEGEHPELALERLRERAELIETRVGENEPQTVAVLSELAHALHRGGNSRDAVIVQMKATRAARARYGENHAEFAANVSNLAVLLGEVGDPQQGMQFAVRADAILAGSEETLEARAENLNVIGVLAMQLKSHDRALKAYQEAARIQREINGPDHLHYSVALGNAAMAALELRRIGLAATCLNESLAVLDRTVGRDHPSAAERLMQLASLRRAQGRSKEVEPLLRQAGESLRMSLGASHPAYALSLNQLAVALAERGRSAEAVDSLIQAAEIQERAFGPRSAALAVTLTNLARIQAARNDRVGARQLLHVAGKIAVEVLGEKHPEYAGHLREAAAIYQDVQEHGPARAALVRAVGILESTLGEKHPEYARAVAELGLVMMHTDERGQGAALVEKGHQLLVEEFGRRHPDVLDSMVRLALAHRLLNRPRESIEQLTDVEDLVRNAMGSENELYAEVLLELGKSYFTDGDHAGAQRVFERAGELFVEQLGHDSPQAATALRFANMVRRNEPRLLEEFAGRAVEQAESRIQSANDARQARVMNLINHYLQ